MSAIFGLVHFDHRPVTQVEVERMQAALIHHGADGGIWRGENVGMGQRQSRFTPQDSGERQPLISDDGGCVLVADARIDNRAELIRGWQLGEPSPFSNLQSPISTIPDSALILYAYQKWGIDCLHHLVGVYAFAIWDRRSRLLFATRSPIVAPSLVYTVTAETFAFATMPSGLHALPGVPRALDDTGLARMLTGLGGDTTTTIYRNVVRLPTGHRLLISNGKIKLEQYWQPDPTHEIRYRRDDEYLEAFSALLDRVVDDHLSAITPVALQLSGGLDSSAVAAVASRLLSARAEPLTAFTEIPRAGFEGTTFQWSYADETPLVQALAAMHPNIHLNLVRTDGQIFLEDLDRIFAHLEMPFQNTSNRVWIEAILAETKRRGMNVLLDGMQGNITLSWSGAAWLVERLRAKEWTQAAQQLASLARTRGLRSALHAFIAQGIMPLLPDPAQMIISRIRRDRQPRQSAWQTMSPINPEFAHAQGVPELASAHNQRVRYRWAADARRARYDALATQDFGAYISAYRAMFGVDMRSPTADVRLAEFCIALPEDQHWRDGESRSLVRRAMRGQLPASVLANHKRGLQAADWFERLFYARQQVNAELTRIEQSELARRVLDVEKMRRLFEQMPTTIETDQHYFAYARILQGGLMIGAFLNWFETEN